MVAQNCLSARVDIINTSVVALRGPILNNNIFIIFIKVVRLKNIVPSDKLFIFRFEVVANSVFKPTLKFPFVFKRIICHCLLALGAFFPLNLRSLISAHMYIRRIKKVANLVKNIKNKLKCAFFATTNRSVPTEIKLSLRNSAAEIARHLRIFNNAGKLLVCSNRSGTVRRKVDFGNNHNSALFCVSNNLFDLLLRVISADRDIVHFNASPTADL